MSVDLQAELVETALNRANHAWSLIGKQTDASGKAAALELYTVRMDEWQSLNARYWEMRKAV